MSNGYMGKILHINLTDRTVEERIIEESTYKRYLSGTGLGAYYLFNHMAENVDPLGPENMIGFMSGLLTGTGSVMTGRWSVVTKSPLTQGWGDANCGGNLSIEIKKCGYDGIFFQGRSQKPIYVHIADEKVRFIDGGDIWGKDAIESEKWLLSKYRQNGNLAVATIGPAGENQSLIAGISNDGGRYAARSGVGAVMGSKNLKALVLEGSHSIKAHNADRTKELTKAYASKVKKSELPSFVKGNMLPFMGFLSAKQKKHGPIDGAMTVAAMKRWGTISNNTLGMPNGDNPVKNWKGSIKDYPLKKYRRLNPDKIIAKETKKYRCHSCIIGCGGICDVTDIENMKSQQSHKPEYETINAFGPLLMNDDLDSLFAINDILNRGGMDSISAGNTVAFAMECFEQGVISSKDMGGLSLEWGNTSAIKVLLEQMIYRKGPGKIFSDGVKKAVERIGEVAAPYAMHIGGQEPGMHDPRMDPLLGIHFSADPTPGRHTIGATMYYNAMHLWEFVSWAPKVKAGSLKKDDFLNKKEVGLKTAASACVKQVLDGAGGCLFALASGLNHWPLFDYLNAVTGWDYTPDDYMEVGRRIQSLRQAFNIREGIRPMDNLLIGRLEGTPPLKEGPLAGNTLDTESMIKKHYEYMGWDHNGNPVL